MATYFTPGTVYTSNNSSFYGTTPTVQPLAQPSPNARTYSWEALYVTPTFVTFASKSGLGTHKKCRVYNDSLGAYVFPVGRFPGAPVLRA